MATIGFQRQREIEQVTLEADDRILFREVRFVPAQEFLGGLVRKNFREGGGMVVRSPGQEVFDIIPAAFVFGRGCKRTNTHGHDADQVRRTAPDEFRGRAGIDKGGEEHQVCGAGGGSRAGHPRGGAVNDPPALEIFTAAGHDQER